MSNTVAIVASAVLVSIVLSLLSMGIFYVIRAKRLRRAQRREGAGSNRREFLIEHDISNGRELNKLPAISCTRNDSTPVDFHYVNEHVSVAPIQIDTSLGRMNCCQCVGDCATSDCECVQLNQAGPHYDLEGRLTSRYLTDMVGAIRECNIGCSCNRKLCKNMVVQAGSKLNLVLFKTSSRGWGVKTREHVARGTFIGNYSGELISAQSSTKRVDDTYLFNLSNAIIGTANQPAPGADHTTDQLADGKDEPDVSTPEARQAEPVAGPGQFAHEDNHNEGLPTDERHQFGDTRQGQVNVDEPCFHLNQLNAQEQPNGTDNVMPATEMPSEQTPEQHFICDAKFYGNFTRFINHSCEPNVVGIRTFTVHQDDRFPYISFFANRDIGPEEELTLNYGDNYWLVKCRRDHVYCLCKASTCKFTKKTFKQTLKKHSEQVHK